MNGSLCSHTCSRHLRHSACHSPLSLQILIPHQDTSGLASRKGRNAAPALHAAKLKTWGRIAALSRRKAAPTRPQPVPSALHRRHELPHQLPRITATGQCHCALAITLQRYEAD
ncbi:hypothetical protein GEV41_05685 [Pseudomonas putida]|nr:hypothetical protein GEV41_05685 [Pseudomonas putida]